MENITALTRDAFDISAALRYIAVYIDGKLSMQQRDAIAGASSGESDRYEELLVNPTLIKLASQRGNIDCGGLEYFIIRYGNFFVILFPCSKGHVNFGIEPSADPVAFIEPLKALLKKYDLL